MPQIPEPLYWDDNNINHLWQSHQVTPDEVEEAIFGCDGEDAVIRMIRDGDGYLVFGETGGNRLLRMKGEYREQDGKFRVYHAKDMDENEKRTYRRGN